MAKIENGISMISDLSSSLHISFTLMFQSSVSWFYIVFHIKATIICDRFWENPYKRGKYHYSISSVLVISLIFVKIFFIMKMDVWNIVLGPGKDIRSGTHYNSRSKPNTVLKFWTSRAASIRKTGTRP